MRAHCSIIRQAQRCGRLACRPNPVSLRTFYGRARHDVYANLSLRPRDLRGWGVDRRLYRKLVSVMTPAVIVEVGVWKGATTIPLAKELKALGAGGVVIAVDTWLGAVEFWTRLMGGERDLQFVNGYPSVYYTFLSNVVHEQVQDVVVPLPSPSLMAAQILTVKHIRPVLLSSSNPGPIARPSSPHSLPSSGHYGPTVGQLVMNTSQKLWSVLAECLHQEIVHLDGSHEYMDVKMDLHAWWQLVTDDGIMFGDDYTVFWPGLCRAVDEFMNETGARMHRRAGKWLFSKRGRLPKGL